MLPSGTAKLFRPDDEEEVRAACEKVLNEMNRADGIYFEQMVNQKGDGRFFQLELEATYVRAAPPCASHRRRTI